VQRDERLPLARELLPGLQVGLVLVGQTAHETAAAAGDLRRIQRQPLVLGQLEADRLDLAQPRRATQLAAAPAHAAEEGRLVPHTDLLQLDAGPERSRQVANQLAEVDATLGREVDRQLVPVELPL